MEVPAKQSAGQPIEPGLMPQRHCIYKTVFQGTHQAVRPVAVDMSPLFGERLLLFNPLSRAFPPARILDLVKPGRRPPTSSA